MKRWRFDDDVLLNFRELGGYPTNGDMTAYGVFFRSDQPSGLSGSDKKRLVDAGIWHVIDLRSPREKEAFPNDFINHPVVTYYDWYMPIGSAELRAMGPQVSCQGDNYVRRLEACGDYYSRLLTLMAELEGGVLFHCTAGKDRTGIVAGLLLMVAGVDEADIIVDYQVSETYLASRIPWFKSFYPTITDWELRSEPGSMRIMLDWLQETYGGVEGYLRQRGMTHETIERLKSKLLFG